jgi:DNA-binding phage protein
VAREILNLSRLRNDVARVGSANKLAQKAGIPASTLTRILNGETKPSLHILAQIASAAGARPARI